MNLSRITIAVSAALTMFFVSCNKDKKNVDTLDSLADEVIASLNRMPEAMSKVKDEESAQAAADVIKEVGDELTAIAERINQFEVPSDEDRKSWDKKIEDGIMGGEEKNEHS